MVIKGNYSHLKAVVVTSKMSAQGYVKLKLLLAAFYTAQDLTSMSRVYNT